MNCRLTEFFILQVHAEKLWYYELYAIERCTQLVRDGLVECVKLSGHHHELIVLFQNVYCAHFVIAVFNYDYDRFLVVDSRVKQLKSHSLEVLQEVARSFKVWAETDPVNLLVQLYILND